MLMLSIGGRCQSPAHPSTTQQNKHGLPLSPDWGFTLLCRTMAVCRGTGVLRSGCSSTVPKHLTCLCQPSLIPVYIVRPPLHSGESSCHSGRTRPNDSATPVYLLKPCVTSSLTRLMATTACACVLECVRAWIACILGMGE